jgi:hypothetical protein
MPWLQKSHHPFTLYEIWSLCLEYFKTVTRVELRYVVLWDFLPHLRTAPSICGLVGPVNPPSAAWGLGSPV